MMCGNFGEFEQISKNSQPQTHYEKNDKIKMQKKSLNYGN